MKPFSFVALSVCSLIIASTANARDPITLFSSKDVRLMKAHPNNDNGAEPAIWTKTGNGIDRSIVSFDMAAVDAIAPDDIAEVKLTLSLDKDHSSQLNFGETGVQVGLFKMHDVDYTEGNRIWDKYVIKAGTCNPNRGVDETPIPATDVVLPSSDKRILKSYPLYEAATWHCSTDHKAANGNKDCSPEENWEGASFALNFGADGRLTNAISTVTHVDEINETQGVYDITTDFKESLQNRVRTLSYLFTKINENIKIQTVEDLAQRKVGKVRYYTKEIAEILPECAGLAPQIEITFKPGL